MATVKITLPNRLGLIFSRLYQEDGKDGAWAIWSTLLDATPNSVAFLKRLSIVKAACEKLTDEISGIEIEDAVKTDALKAVRRLTTLTDPTRFSESIVSWKKLASSQDATNLLSMHYVYLHHSMANEYESSTLADVVSGLHELKDEIKGSHLGDELKNEVLSKLQELIYFLERVERYGLEATWEASSSFAGTTMKLGEEIKEQSPDLNDKMVMASRRVFKWLTVAATIKGGVDALSAGGAFLLDAFISSAK